MKINHALLHNSIVLLQYSKFVCYSAIPNKTSINRHVGIQNQEYRTRGFFNLKETPLGNTSDLNSVNT